MGTLATRLVLLPPNDLQSKGMVERGKGFFETSFMPDRVFTSAADFNEQFTDWLGRANSRTVRTLGQAPRERLGADLAAMLPLPPRGGDSRGGQAQLASRCHLRERV